MHYNESKLAHRLLDGKRGIEIGASKHNPFGLDAWNVDYTDDPTALFQKAQVEVSGSAAKVHIIAPGDKLPLANNSVDFVVNSHVLEHFYDPIKTIEEWLRVVKPGGFVYMDIPHKERTFDRPRNRTTLAELIDRHSRPLADVVDAHGHHSVWITEDVLELCRHFNWTVAEWRDSDDKLGIGFTVVLKKT
uniref:Methyltransferase type 11 domain-containing protein n=1 Tax=Globodera rostochiensis TaxID=31243 RepID=A0A914GPA6_GLORO